MQLANKYHVNLELPFLLSLTLRSTNREASFEEKPNALQLHSLKFNTSKEFVNRICPDFIIICHNVNIVPNIYNIFRDII